MKKKYIYILVILLFASCAKEDPNLVNPPPPYQSIRIRLLNGFNSNDLLAWGYNNKVYSEPVSYLGLTKSQIPPPNDSIKIEFYQNNSLVFSTDRKIRLVRETRYLVVGGKTLKDGSTIDTFMVLSTTYGLPKKLGKSYFKFVNLVRDSSLKATLIEGCPNGKPLISDVPYFAYPYLQTIPFGKYTISVIIKQGSNSSLLNIYSVDFQEDLEYTIFLAEKVDGTIGLFLYNDYDTTQTHLVELSPISERVSFIRTVNLSSERVSVSHVPGQVLDANIEPKRISKYHSISACESKLLDSLEVMSPFGSSYIGYSFEIFKKYTLLVFDSLNGSKKLLIVPPGEMKEHSSGLSTIRVVNAVDTNFAMTLSMGARNVKKGTGFRSGEVLAANLKSNRISTPVLIEPGYLPLTLFSSTEPTFLIKPSFAEVEPNKSYLIIISKTETNEIEITLLADEDEDFNVQHLETGCFLQVLNAYTFTSNLNFSISNYLQNIKVNYKESFASVLPKNANSIIINDVNNPIFLDTNKIGLLVVSGKEGEYQVFDLSISTMGKEMNSFRRRFFNGSKEVENVGIFYDSSKRNVVVHELRYGSASGVEKVFLERKFSLVYFDNQKGTIVAQFNDIFLSFGKNYTLVFTGSKARGFSLIVVQEY